MPKPRRGSDLPRALLLAPEAPYPLVGGGPLRTASLVEYLGRRFQLDCLLFREEGAPDPRASLPEGLVSRADVLPLPAHSRKPLARLVRNGWRAIRKAPPLNDRFAGFDRRISALLRGRSYDFALIEHFWCAPYVDALAAVSGRVALDLHNIESEFYRTTLEVAPAPVRGIFERFYRGCLELEDRWLPRFPLILAASADDAARLLRRLPGRTVEVVPNTIPFVPLPEAAPENSLVFSGNLEYHPNLAAVRFFHRQVWPLVKGRQPGLRWRILGRNADLLRREFGAEDGIELVSAVTEAVAEIARSRVAVVPVLSGSGTRVKILEAWAAGVPVVATPKGAEGLPARDGEHLLLARDAGSFADAVLRLLASEEQRRGIGAAGRDLYERCFTWQAAWRRLEEVGIRPLPADGTQVNSW